MQHHLIKKPVLILCLALSLSLQAFAQTAGTAQATHKDIATQYVNEIINNKKLFLLKYVFDTGYVFHNIDGSDTYGMRDTALISNLYTLFTAFPDLRYSITHIAAEGDVVALNLIGSGTHRAAYMGYGPTQKMVTYK